MMFYEDRGTNLIQSFVVRIVGYPPCIHLQSRVQISIADHFFYSIFLNKLGIWDLFYLNNFVKDLLQWESRVFELLD